MKKQPYTPFVSMPGDSIEYRVPKTYLCDMANANACQKRASWYGTETIGPRLYAVYQCSEHGRFKRRVNRKDYAGFI